MNYPGGEAVRARHEAEKERLEKARRDAGRYNFDEAASFISEVAKERREVILEKLVRSAESGALKTYAPNSLNPYEFPRNGAHREEVFNAYWQDLNEIYWQDLNAWLKEFLPLVEFEFLNSNTPAASEGAPVKGIPKQKVITAFKGLHFKTDARWSKALSDTPKWLEPCRMIRGKRGDNSSSSLWNPVLIAVELYSKGIQINKLDAVFVGLKDWADEWREGSTLFRA